MILILTLLIIILVANSSIISNSVAYGLMLWYKNVIPLLLPFILISNLISQNIITQFSDKNNFHNYSIQEKKSNIFPKLYIKAKTIFIILFLGLFCGYPLGAKMCADFSKEKIISVKLANILLPLCNNVSPMFLSGYIISSILENKVDFLHVIVFIYTPYIIFSSIKILYYYPPTKITKENQKNISIAFNLLTSSKKLNISTKINSRRNNHTIKQLNNNNNILINTITQITYIGIYITICTICIGLIKETSIFPNSVSFFLTSILEITSGANEIANAVTLTYQAKKALILAITSFGGVSSILQTKSVIKESELSIINYILTKSICALSTYILALLLI